MCDQRTSDAANMPALPEDLPTAPARLPSAAEAQAAAVPCPVRRDVDTDPSSISADVLEVAVRVLTPRRGSIGGDDKGTAAVTMAVDSAPGPAPARQRLMSKARASLLAKVHGKALAPSVLYLAFWWYLWTLDLFLLCFCVSRPSAD